MSQNQNAILVESQAESSFFESVNSTPSRPTLNFQEIRAEGQYFYVINKREKVKFETWWKTTPVGFQNESRPKNAKFSINWTDVGRADYWEHFQEVVNKITGEPKVYCTRCGWLGTHPSTMSLKSDGSSSRTGNSTLGRHIFTSRCRGRAAESGKTQVSIEDFTSSRVRKVRSFATMQTPVLKLTRDRIRSVQIVLQQAR